jgi:hypothetical protein
MKNNKVLEHLFPTSEADKEEFFRSVDEKIRKAAAMRRLKLVRQEFKKFLESVKGRPYGEQIIEAAVLQLLEDLNDVAASSRTRSA